MKFNPCGMVLDYMKACYETEVYPFANSDIAVGWRWYPALPTAKTFPGWSFLCSRNWLDFHDETFTLGEVNYQDKQFQFNQPIAEAKGEKYCGTLEEFEDGQVYDEDSDPTMYNQNGIPACCLDVAAGLVAGEGTPAALRSPPNYYRGAVSAEGRPSALVTAAISYQGAVSGEGRPSALVTVVTRYVGSVSGEGTPAALVTGNWLYVGGVGGEGTPAALTVMPVYHLGDVGGEGTPAALLTAAISYVGEVGGEGCPAHAGTPYSDPAEGGFMIGGESGDTYTPGTPTPGTSCADAYPIDLGTEYSHDMPAPGASDWWAFAIAEDGPFHVAATGIEFPDATLTIWDITDCPLIAGVGISIVGPPCWDVLLFGGRTYAIVIASASGSGSYTFTANLGAC